VAGRGHLDLPAQATGLHRPLGLVAEVLPGDLVQHANTLLREKVLFGSDYPFLTPDRWIAEFDKLAIRDEVRPLILKDNAARLLGLVPAP
jgi:predicted TIM-barrel fold metal-dependent hydrolase